MTLARSKTPKTPTTLSTVSSFQFINSGLMETKDIGKFKYNNTSDVAVASHGTHTTISGFIGGF
jgi:hypothetical protein